MPPGRSELGKREYPRTWYLLDLVDREPRLLSREVVDLSPAAIELRRVARELREYADERDRWMRMGDRSRWPRLEERHRRRLSFGPVVGYCVERDGAREIHGGKPFRHLAVRLRSRVLTPATSAEIALYFYGRRPAVFGFPEPARAHGFIGLGWEPLDREDLRWLLRREMGPSS